MLVLMLFLLLPSAMAQGNISMKFANESLPSIFSKLEKASGYKILFTYNDVESYQVNGQIKNVSFNEAMNYVLEGKPLTYHTKGEIVNVVKSSIQPKKNQEHRPSLRGEVIEMATGYPIIGATVKVKGTKTMTVTDVDGMFTLDDCKEGARLVISYIGMKNREVAATDRFMRIPLEADAEDINEVVVTGIVNRKASSFTGSISSFNNEKLKQVGSQNVIKSLELLEPSLLKVTNLGVGSDPNSLPSLELNGTSSFPDVTGQYTGNPNQPLFILNGFESDLQTINDLDMNLVKSVTILKDASAKAIYGSKASNGVVIVDTKRPEAGKLQVYYSGAVSLEVPDLTSYNLCNAREKLQAEVASGQVYNNAYQPDAQVTDNTIYNELYKEVLRGVDTYWLSAPLRTGVGNKHTLSIDGGTENYIYGLNLSYNKITGAMKNSDRETLNGTMSVEYRLKSLSVRNQVSINYNNQNNPYHDFSTYASLNPYWRKYDTNDNPVKEFKSVRSGIYNPLWDDQWKAYDKSNYTEITDNFDLDWTILQGMRLVGRFNFTKTTTNSESFRSPYLTEFNNSDKDEKGSYTKGLDKNFTMGGDLNLSYSHAIADKHIFFYNVGTSMQMSNYDDYSFTAYGFPDETDFLYFAKGYKTDDKPSASEGKERELSFLGIFNYSYMDRYLVDASIRTTGSSQFGRDKRWGNFWSAGLGWNVHNEPFIANHKIAKMVNLLKIRGSYGYTGSQNFNSYQAIPTYQYYSRYYYDGSIGAYLQAFPNTKLQWQEKLDTNLGIDMTLWKKLNIAFNYYKATTKNSIGQLTVAPSIGFTSYAENIGDIENKGFDLNASYTVFNQPSTRSYLTFNFSMAHNKNVIKKISDAMKKYNETLDAQKEGTANVGSSASVRNQYTRPAARYVEGRSMTAIWGVKSAGIDPLTGQEVYIRPNGEKTLEWNAADQQVIGDSRPDLHGTFGFNLQYRGFMLNAVFSYQLGGDYYNTTLVDKVENANIYNNVDRRYLYDRWQKAGDVSYFKDIANSEYTKPTSRFIMKNNQLVISSINVGYNFRDWKFMKRIGFSSLLVQAYLNDLATLSSVKQERGTSYPFARNVNLGVSFNF